MILRTQRYSYTLVYAPGSAIPIADALSRSPMNESSEYEPFHVDNVTFCPVNDSRLAKIKDATDKDSSLQMLKQTIVRGWPDYRSQLPQAIQLYHSYRDELTVQDGIVFIGSRVVIPRSMRSDMKQRVHAGHLGINACLRRARDIIFWPGMSSELRQFVESCSVCATYSDQQSPEPVSMHDVCHRPWEKAGTDLFTIHGRNYLVTVDYYSKFFEVDYLPETTSDMVITKLKHHFARHGIPDVVVRWWSTVCIWKFSRIQQEVEFSP